MSDIYGAMAAEAAYVHNRTEGLETAPLSEALAEYGYLCLDDYFAEKRDTQVRSMPYEVYTGDMTSIPDAITQAVKAKKPSIFWPSCSRLFVWHGNDTLDVDLCGELGIDVLDMGYRGGTIVSGPEDFSFGVLLPETVDVEAGYFLSMLQAIFNNHGVSAEVDGNDILIDGRKVAGSMSFRKQKLFFFGCQISFSDHADLVEILCNKKSSKTPGFVPPELSKEVLMSEVMAWLRKQDQ